MARLALMLVLVLLALGVLRVLRIVLASVLARPRSAGRPGEVQGEVVRDPVCGAWVDRRLAVEGRRGAEMVHVCSEKCRQLLEAQ